MQNESVSSEQLLGERPRLVKNKFKTLGKLLVIAYLLLPFFQDLPDESSKDIEECSAILLRIPTIAYSWLQILLAASLIFCRHMLEREPTKPRKTFRFFISVIILGVVIISDFVVPQRVVSLSLRVPLLLCCSPALEHLVRVYLSIIYSNLRYYGLMWMSIVVFWASGDLLFGDDTMEGGNMFQSPLDAVWNLLVLQSTANFPDVALPFVQLNIGSILFYVVFLFCNTIIVSNIIIANSYDAYKQATQEYELSKGLTKVLSYVMKKKKKKTEETQALKKMGRRSRVLRAVVTHPLYKLNQWVLNVVMFLMVCFHPIRQFPNSILVTMIIITLVLSISPVIRATTMPMKLVLKRTFLVYDLMVIGVTLPLSVFILSEDHRFNYLYPYFALFRIPHIFKPIIQFLFKDELASLEYTTRASPTAIQVHHRFTPRLLAVFYTLFLVMLQFSGIGIAFFQSVLSTSVIPTLSQRGLNPAYVYLNFNTTLSSFITLFSLVIVNNWNMIVEVYVVIVGSKWVRAYFVCFFMFGVLVAYNTVVACIIECVVSLAQRKRMRQKTPVQQMQAEDKREHEYLKKYIEEQIQEMDENQGEL